MQIPLPPCSGPAPTETPDKEITVTIRNRRGLHARAAAKFVRLAESFNAAVQVRRSDGAETDEAICGTSIMGLMMLAAAPGCVLQLQASGAQAPQALDALRALVERGFDEDM